MRFRLTVSLLLISLLSLPQARAQGYAPPAYNAGEMLVLLQKAQVVGSVLYVAAHPDDENTALLAYMARERKVRAGYLSMTRGDGGQNLIGAEQSELLGIIRTQELLAARRIDGAEQFFTRANDFGFSKNPDETFRIWNKDSILKDVVWVIRNFRPDVIITRFPTTGEGGHGHHTASAILAVEAFKLAGDATAYPEQLQYVQPWQPKRLFWNSFNFTGNNATPEPGALQIDLGTYNPLLGRAYTEIAGLSRSQHKSQGFGAPQRRGERKDNFKLLAGDAATADVLEGVDLSWKRLPGGEVVGKLLADAEAAFNPQKPEAVLPQLLAAYQAAQKLPAHPLLAYKLTQLQELILAAATVFAEATADAYSYTPGDSIKVATTLIKRSAAAVAPAQLTIGFAGVNEALTQQLNNNIPLVLDRKVKLPTTIAYTTPYWLAQQHDQGLFVVNDRRLVGTPENQPALLVSLQVTVGEAGTGTNGNAQAPAAFTLNLPVRYKWTDAVAGEQYRPIEVLPPVTLGLSEKSLILNGTNARTIQVKLHSNAGKGAAGTVQLSVPQGFKVSPAQAPFVFGKKDQEQSVSFTVSGNGVPGVIKAIAASNGNTFTQDRVRIHYDHIPPQVYLPPAEIRLNKIDAKVAAKRVGYVPGAGDDIPASLRQLGLEVTLLTDAELSTGNLTKYDAIVAGVRAYNTQERLKAWQPRLMEYVKNGGTYIVQYVTERTNLVIPTDSIGPYPFKVVRDRVTDENAPVTFQLKDHSALNTPNKITSADFDGWVQERGIYFAGSPDKAYEAPLLMNDPGEKPNSGSLIVAKYGKGHFVYTGLVFFRQLPAGVPGAYRLFANLLSLGR
jgi:LmbE family N-acetylglucosaminyl deacetylase